MIFGRTFKDCQHALTVRNAYRLVHTKWFAWRPVRLVDGRWAWLQYVHVHRGIVIHDAMKRIEFYMYDKHKYDYYVEPTKLMQKGAAEAVEWLKRNEHRA